MPALRAIPPTKFDYFGQMVLMLPFCMGLIVPFYGWLVAAFIALPLGSWQVMSALYYIMVRSDRKRLPYLTCVGAYGIWTLCIIFFILEGSFDKKLLLAFIEMLAGERGSSMLVAWVSLVGAVVMAIWYFALTTSLYDQREAIKKPLIPDILDDGDWETKVD